MLIFAAPDVDALSACRILTVRGFAHMGKEDPIVLTHAVWWYRLQCLLVVESPQE